MTKSGIQAQVEEGVTEANKSFLQEIKQLLGLRSKGTSVPATAPHSAGGARKGAAAAVDDDEDEDETPDQEKPEASELQQAVMAMAAEIKTLKAELAAARKETRNQVATVQEESTTAIEAKEKEVSTRANIKARETLAKAGHAAVAEETPNAPKNGKSRDDLWAQYHAMPNGKAKREFYLANKETLNSDA